MTVADHLHAPRLVDQLLDADCPDPGALVRISREYRGQCHVADHQRISAGDHADSADPRDWAIDAP